MLQDANIPMVATTTSLPIYDRFGNTSLFGSSYMFHIPDQVACYTTHLYFPFVE
jgi:hypothetical protein